MFDDAAARTFAEALGIETVGTLPRCSGQKKGP
jgi:hypothetical protein